MNWPLLRGQVVQADIGLEEPKLFVVVSNNRRNAQLGSVLAVRLTTTHKPEIPSIVEMAKADPLGGRAVCDDIIEVFPDEVLAIRGGVTAGTLSRINAGLKAALGLD